MTDKFREGLEKYSELQRLLGVYWEAAYAEGKEGRDHDTEEGIAGETLFAIQELFKSQTYDPAKWKLVPVIPTQAMQDAGRDANDKYARVVAPLSAIRAVSAWEAMLAAAPTYSEGEKS